jgi:iron only hydrogenase large subunit-like protein
LQRYGSLNGERFAFLSPCAHKWREFVLENENPEELVHYNITIESLHNWLEKEAVNLQQYAPVSMETGMHGNGLNNRGLTVAAFGSIGKSLSALMPGLHYHIEQGIKNAAGYLEKTEDLRGENFYRLFEPYACVGGCAHGLGIGKARSPLGENPPEAMDFLKTADPGEIQKITELFAWFDQNLDMNDFCHSAETEN